MRGRPSSQVGGRKKIVSKTPSKKIYIKVPSTVKSPWTKQRIVGTPKQKGKSLVLDLDETLIHAEVRTQLNPKLAKRADFHFQLNGQQYYIFKRPGLENFLKLGFQEFENVGIWTTGMASYAKNILKHILTKEQAEKLSFIFTRGHCPHDTYGYYKPLEKVWRQYSNKHTRNNTIMIDNTQLVMRKNLENGIVSPDFDMKKLNDQYLPWLSKMIKYRLKKMSSQDFVKLVNKNTPI